MTLRHTDPTRSRVYATQNHRRLTKTVKANGNNTRIHRSIARGDHELDVTCHGRIERLSLEVDRNLTGGIMIDRSIRIANVRRTHIGVVDGSQSTGAWITALPSRRRIGMRAYTGLTGIARTSIGFIRTCRTIQSE